MQVLTRHRHHVLARRPSGFLFPATVVGTTTNVQVYSAIALGASGQAVAKDCLTRVQMDFQQLRALFGNQSTPSNATLVVSPLSSTEDGTGGAEHMTCADTTEYCDAAVQNPKRTSALFVAELSESFQAAQNGGWDCGATNGEGLSRIHAEVLYPGALDDFTIAAAWLDSPDRPNYVDQNLPTDTDGVSNGLSVLFINWLAWLGYGYDKITQAAAPSLAGTYSLLSGKLVNTAWQDFSAAVSKYWPAGRPSGVTTDNPWSGIPNNPPPPPPPPPPPSGTTLIVMNPLPVGTYEVVAAAAKK